MVDAVQELQELLFGDGTSLDGFDGELWEAEAQALSTFSHRPFCLVRDWRIIDLEVDEAYRESLLEDGLAPSVLYAREVVKDSAARLQTGTWVRSMYLRSLTKSYLFESVNTVYVLLGPGTRKSGSGRAVMNIGKSSGPLGQG